MKQFRDVSYMIQLPATNKDTNKDIRTTNNEQQPTTTTKHRRYSLLYSLLEGDYYRETITKSKKSYTSMRQKHLESALSSVQREFPNPQVALEQYPTSPQLTASVILTALQQQQQQQQQQYHPDIGPGRTALDLGCGTGMLGLACAVVNTDHVIGVDCDQAALQVALQNAVKLQVEDRIDFVRGRVKGVDNSNDDDDDGGNTRASTAKQNSRSGRKNARGGGGNSSSSSSKRGGRRFSGRTSAKNNRSSSTQQTRQLILSDDDGLALKSKCVDTVFTNPPFGTKNNAGMDLRFLRTATRLARRAVYSFHKTSTRDFLVKQVQNVWGMQVQVLAQMKFDLPCVYKFHKEKSVDVEVDLLRVAVSALDDDDDHGQLGAIPKSLSLGETVESATDEADDDE